MCYSSVSVSGSTNVWLLPISAVEGVYHSSFEMLQRKRLVAVQSFIILRTNSAFVLPKPLTKRQKGGSARFKYELEAGLSLTIYVAQS